MTKKRALEMAIQALNNEKQKAAVDAHLAEYYGMETAHAQKCVKQRAEICEAIKVLETLKHDAAYY